jgi:glycosyltransferase involved in cell wall biosynthesis
VARVPIRVYTAHGWAFRTVAGRSARLYLWADRLVRPLATMTICISESDLRAGLAAGVCRADRTTVIPNSVDPGDPPAARGSSVPVKIVTVGRLAWPKDYETLIRAFATLGPGAVLSVVGDGPLRPEIERELDVKGLTDRVTLVGEVDDVRARLADADIFVLASRSEGMPMSILEAMAAGLPVVASSVGGVPEVVVDGQSGFLVAPSHPDELADRLRRLTEDERLRRAFGAAGRARVEERFALAASQRAHLQLYDSLLLGEG